MLVRVAHPQQIQVFAVDVRSPDQIDASFKTIPHLRADAVLVLADAMMVSNVVPIVRHVAAQQLPAIYSFATFAAAGGLMSYEASEVEMWSQAATYVARILKGAKAADLPVERPTVFELVVNLKTARNIGIAVPQSILLRATEIIR